MFYLSVYPSELNSDELVNEDFKIAVDQREFAHDREELQIQMAEKQTQSSKSEMTVSKEIGQIRSSYNDNKLPQQYVLN